MRCSGAGGGRVEPDVLDSPNTVGRSLRKRGRKKIRPNRASQYHGSIHGC